MADLIERIEAGSMPIPESGCMIWMGHLSERGYGRIQVGGKTKRVHKVAYEAAIGPVPAGLVLDHKCRVRSCCNPAHLEPVTNRSNILRGVSRAAANARKTHCLLGHPLVDGNLEPFALTRGERRCVICRNAQGRARRKASKGTRP